VWTRWFLVLALAMVVRPSFAVANSDDPDRQLTAKEVARYFEPYVPGVRACYLTRTKGKTVNGKLRLELIIHHAGHIFRFGFDAPGVDKPTRAKLDKCLRGLVPSWRMPARKGFTTVVLPFLFLKTTAPGAGPIESCWDARGCPPGKAGGSK
jgi:hypothetical protein